MALGLACQSAVQALPPNVLFPLIMVKAIGGSGVDFLWAIFSMLLVNGITSILQALRIGPVGSGLIVATYPSIAAVPFCILALDRSGPTLLAVLILVSAMTQIFISYRLSLMRKIVTPKVSGTILILMVITIVPILFGNISDALGSPLSTAGFICLAVTFVATLGPMLKGGQRVQVWAPIIGLGSGCLAAGALGIFDLEPFRTAPIAGLPLASWPGFSFDLARSQWLAFLGLAPIFALLGIVSVVQTSSIGVATQRVSWREPRSLDYRVVQGASICTGVGNLLASLVGILPVVTIPRGITFILQTGCASRYVGALFGSIIVLAAFVPKSWALLMGIPGPVNVIFVAVMLSPLVVEGVKLIAQEAPDFRRSLIIGTSVIIGLGFQAGLVTLPIGDLMNTLLATGLTAGTITLVVLILFTETKRRRIHRLATVVHIDSLPGINGFITQVSEQRELSEQITQRMQAVAEEILLTLAEPNGKPAAGASNVRIAITEDDNGAILEFVVDPGDADNLEDRIALLTTAGPTSEMFATESGVTDRSRNISLRLLGALSSSVTHQQYYETEIITVRVAGP